MLKKELPKLTKIHPGIISGPDYWGLSDLTNQYACLLVGFSCNEKEKVPITCMMNAELCRIFDEHGFEMGISPIELKL